MDKFKAVILAAGKGTRMQSDLPKVLHKVDGKPMVHYTIQAAKDAGATDVIVIVGYQGQLVKREIVDYSYCENEDVHYQKEEETVYLYGYKGFG